MKKIIISIIALVIMGVIIAFTWYKMCLMPVVMNKSAEGIDSTSVVIAQGSGINTIVSTLKNAGVIKSEFATKIYIALNGVTNLQAGKYELNSAEDTATILEHIAKGEVAPEDLNITFVEGKNMRWYAKTIAEKTNNTEEDVFNLLSNEEYIDSLISKYWFLTDEIKDENIYYPLEGYLLPDTYTFDNKDVSVETIFNVLLNYTDKYLSSLRNDLDKSTLTVHQILTMASMAELEGKSDEDRAEIIGVFYNRILKNMSLGSDVTTYYAFKVDMGERDLTAKELNTENKYNTRGPNMSGKIPIGPICNPSKSAIKATINYKTTDCYYFVADKNGKVYFTKTNDEHEAKIKELKSNNLWYEY